MGTTRTFSTMLNEYLPNELLKEEFTKRDYILSNIEKDDTWKGGNLVVPFKAAGASSVAFGGLSASNDIAEDSYVEDFMDYMKMVVSVNLLNGQNFAATTAASSSASGLLVLDRPDRCVIGQKVVIAATAPATITAYISAINMNTLTVTFVTTRGGATVVDFSANNVASGAALYNDGAQTSANVFSSLRGTLLSAANSGDSTIYGQTKTAYPYLQAINVSGASVTAVNIMEKIFDTLTTIRQFGKGAPTEAKQIDLITRDVVIDNGSIQLPNILLDAFAKGPAGELV